MGEEFEIRESGPSDMLLLERLYPDAFPEEDLLPVVRDLLKAGQNVLSLVAILDGRPAGHIAFTGCRISGEVDKVALLGPLAVASGEQRRGIGGALVREGLERLKAGGTRQVHVLGDPAYYGRFGFEPAAAVVPPYPLPAEWSGAWQSLSLRDGMPVLEGRLAVPHPWDQPSLWAP